MFSTLGLFKETQCPEPVCRFSCCIFAHAILAPGTTSIKDRLKPSSSIHVVDAPEMAGKKRKLNAEQPYHNCTPTLATSAVTSTRMSHDISPITPRMSVDTVHKNCWTSDVIDPKNDTQASWSSGTEGQRLAARAMEISLNPRILNKPPATHAIRRQLLVMLHEQICRLNNEMKSDKGPENSVLKLSPSEVIRQALSEEERFAIESPSIYLNTLKSRIMRLKKMKSHEWRRNRQEQMLQLPESMPTSASHDSQPSMQLEVSASDEIAFLSRFSMSIDTMKAQGYLTQQVSDAEIEDAHQGVLAAQGWELCDRCGTRFQVFPGRRMSDGAMTSGGHCLYHPGKPRRMTTLPKSTENTKDLTFCCCNETLGSTRGCTKASTHVFKVLAAKRLAMIMPYEATPFRSEATAESSAMSLDCEMGYTTLGLELIRLTAISWPHGETFVDVLVRPIGEILDLNSRYSGVWPHNFANAMPFEKERINSRRPSKSLGDNAGTQCSLQIIDSPAAARTLLFTHLSQDTALIGHALENDLHATRIIHPYVIDTAFLFPHPRGPPLRLGLKGIAKKYLNRDIQSGDDSGHDSLEDARAAGDLVRLFANTRRRQMLKTNQS